MTDPLTLARELRALADAATPGEWKAHPRVTTVGPSFTPVGARTLIARVYSEAYGDIAEERANANFIARARTGVPALCDAMEALAKERDALRAALKPFVEYADKAEDLYRKRGGNPDSFPDDHPFSNVPADALPCGVWRKARAALGGQP